MSIFFGTAARFWTEIVQRPAGPLGFRYILQPLMAAALATRDGYRDAANARPPFFWSIVRDPRHCAPHVMEGIRAVLRIIILAVLIDVVYQIIVFKGLRPIQTIYVVLILAIIPYFILRGPAERIARWWISRHRPKDHHASASR
jgi:hypothetical protein